MGWLPRAALQIAPPDLAPAIKWDGKWRRVIKSHGCDLGQPRPGSASEGAQFIQANSTAKVDHGARRAIGSPAQEEAPDVCAANLELYSRYLMVEDNQKCGGMNVSFTGIYVDRTEIS